MSRRNDFDISYNLEKRLQESIERMSEVITRNRKLSQEITRLRRIRRGVPSVPDEVRQWFEDVEGYEEEEE